ncbi:MAG: transporter substrate-binding domain-containing protein [Candidatus Omnitrophica bacterium]|nr:transporter substrate-binding domain-containing protein [Candidatus Omnitrophota bacterium]
MRRREGLPGILRAGVLLFAGCLIAFKAAGAPEPLKLLVIGEQPPYHWQTSSGTTKGFDIDLANNVGEILGRPVTIRQVNETEARGLVASGDADAVIGLPDNKAGRTFFDYSSPYLVQKTRIFVREGTAFVRKLTDLRGLQVGVGKGADVSDYLSIIPRVRVVTEADAEAGLRSLLNRETTVFLGDEYECEYVIQTMRLAGLETVGGPILVRRRVLAVRKGNAELLGSINDALDRMKGDLRLQTIAGKWFARHIRWAGLGTRELIVLLVVLGVAAAVLLVTVIWNHKLSQAVDVRTRELQAEHAHFENIFEHASDGIVLLDADSCRATHANKAFEEILGFTEEELKKIELSELDASSERHFANQIHRATACRESVLFEARLLNKTREPVDLVIHARAFPFGDKPMVEAIARDVTEKKKLEAMKDTILQDVAHELKTPMAKLSMSIQLLEKKMPPALREPFEKHFDVAKRSVLRLQSTIEGILNLSRLESKATSVQMDIFVLQEVVQNVVQELQMFADRKNIGLENHMPSEPALIQGDLEMIRRLFVNLIHNAIKFTSEGAVALGMESDGQFVKVSVKDTGIGLEKHELSKIFDRFYQKSAAYEGSGVGLTICQKIVTFHNGVIWAESDGPGFGTSMLVMFPLFQTESGRDADQ